MNPGFHDGGEGNGAQLRSASYRLPALDQDFLLGASMRGVRFLLERPELSGGSSPSVAGPSVWTEAFVTTSLRPAAAPV